MFWKLKEIHTSTFNVAEAALMDSQERPAGSGLKARMILSQQRGTGKGVADKCLLPTSGQSLTLYHKTNAANKQSELSLNKSRY